MKRLLLSLLTALTFTACATVVAAPASFVAENNGWRIEVHLQDLLTFQVGKFTVVGAVAVGTKEGQIQQARYNIAKTDCDPATAAAEKVIVLTSPTGHDIHGYVDADTNEDTKALFAAICNALPTARMIPIDPPVVKPTKKGLI